MTEDDFVTSALGNPVNAAIIDVLRAAALPDAWIVSGCLVQTVWNVRSGRPVDHGILDYDVFYFDPDTSWGAEDAVIRHIASCLDGIDAKVEVRNQARVHLWYGQRFGGAYPQLRSATDGIDRYLVQCTCIGIEAATGRLYAPNGLEDMVAGVLRPNPLNPSPELFRAKAESYRARWPWLIIAE